MRRARGRAFGGRRIIGRALVATLLAVVLACAGAACTTSEAERVKDPGYMCPRLVQKCRQCRARIPGFSMWLCQGSDGTILERCRGRAEGRRAWLEDLSSALAKDSCREFNEAL
jgi:hypothetical protein